MENLALTAELTFTGLIIGLFISLPIAAITSGICEALQPASDQHKVGLLMVIGIMISSSVISIAVMVKKYREIKNPPSLARAG